MSASGNLEADPEQLRRKYLAERDKRLHPDGNAQYVSLEDAFADYAVDPHVPADFDRASHFRRGILTASASAS